MLINKVGLVCIATGLESFLELPKPMCAHDALTYCERYYDTHRVWLCFAPILRNGHVMIPYDYYILYLSLGEAEGLLRMVSSKPVQNHFKQMYRTRGLLDCSNNFTTAGFYVVDLLKNILPI